MKTKEELDAIREEIIALNEKLSKLTAEELEQITGGIAPGRTYWKNGVSKKNNTSTNGDE